MLPLSLLSNLSPSPGTSFQGRLGRGLQGLYPSSKPETSRGWSVSAPNPEERGIGQCLEVGRGDLNRISLASDLGLVFQSLHPALQTFLRQEKRHSQDQRCDGRTGILALGPGQPPSQEI